VVFAMFAGFYFWWPKFTGRMLDETLGKVHFWLLFIGFHTTFLVQHWLGVEGMPRRYVDYLPDDGFTTLNQVSTIGAFLLGASTLPFFYNVYVSAKGPKVAVDDPWGWGRSLEWATSSPPPRHNFVTLPRIRSESPAFDLHHPDVALKELGDNPKVDEEGGSRVDAPEETGRREHLESQVRGGSPRDPAGAGDATGSGDGDPEGDEAPRRGRLGFMPKRFQMVLFVFAAVGAYLVTVLIMAYVLR
jgi:cytochrome c oxidase subunit 1